MFKLIVIFLCSDGEKDFAKFKTFCWRFDLVLHSSLGEIAILHSHAFLKTYITGSQLAIWIAIFFLAPHHCDLRKTGFFSLLSQLNHTETEKPIAALFFCTFLCACSWSKWTSDISPCSSFCNQIQVENGPVLYLCLQITVTLSSIGTYQSLINFHMHVVHHLCKVSGDT